MASWTLLLLASTLLGSLGLGFSGLSPECYDLEAAAPCDGERLSQGLAQGGPQGSRGAAGVGKGLRCLICQWIVEKLQNMVGKQPDENALSKVASRVCNKVKRGKDICRKIIKKYFTRISQSILAGKTSRTICVGIRLCKSTAGTPGVPWSLQLFSAT